MRGENVGPAPVGCAPVCLRTPVTAGRTGFVLGRVLIVLPSARVVDVATTAASVVGAASLPFPSVMRP
jgi:hypothetical protein